MPRRLLKIILGKKLKHSKKGNFLHKPNKKIFSTETRPVEDKDDEIKGILSILGDRSNIHWVLYV